MNFVRYNHEIFPTNHTKPNQRTHFVRYNRVFVVTVIVITEFDCIQCPPLNWITDNRIVRLLELEIVGPFVP
jgi:hypothetical protein